MAERKNSLHWFPEDPAEWLTRTARLTPIARAAYQNLRCQAWLAHSRGEPAASIPRNPVEWPRLAALTTTEWKKVSGDVMAFFTEREGVMVDTNLLDVWKRQMVKYGKRRGAAGVRWQHSSTNGDALHQQSGSKGGASRGGGTTPPTTGTSADAVRAVVDSGTASVGELAGRIELASRIARWRLDNAAIAETLDTECRSELNLPRARMLTGDEEARLHRLMLTRIEGPQLKVADGGQH